MMSGRGAPNESPNVAGPKTGKTKPFVDSVTWTPEGIGCTRSDGAPWTELPGSTIGRSGRSPRTIGGWGLDAGLGGTRGWGAAAASPPQGRGAPAAISPPARGPPVYAT